MPHTALGQAPVSETLIVETPPSADLAALISNLSHGLRTPLNPVLGFIELLLETELDATQREYLEQAHRGVLDIGHLLTTLTTSPHMPALRSPRPARADVVGSESTPRPDAWRPRVLIVDDDPVNRQVAEYMVTRLGHDVETACDGLEAVQSALDQEYDLILMDLQMPQMGGLDAIDAIREALPWHQQPVIFAVTAGAASGDQHRFETSGMDGCVTKPVRLHELNEVMDEIAQSTRASRAWALALRPPESPIVDLDALDDWIGRSGMTTSLVELIVPTLIVDLGELVGRLELAERTGDDDILESAADLLERSRSVFVSRLTWMLEHLVGALRRSDWTAAVTLSAPLLTEYLTLENWMARSGA